MSNEAEAQEFVQRLIKTRRFSGSEEQILEQHLGWVELKENEVEIGFFQNAAQNIERVIVIISKSWEVDRGVPQMVVIDPTGSRLRIKEDTPINIVLSLIGKALERCK